MSGGRGRLALVTGGAGFIGGHLVEGLLGAGWRVRVLDDFSSGREANLAAAAERIELVQADVRDEAAVARALAGVEVAFHHAAIASVPRSIEDPIRSHEVNLGGTLVVLEGARRAGVRRVVFAASSAAYGDGPEPVKVETLPPRPLSPYGLQKWSSEVYCALYTRLHGLETVSLRYFNVFGPRQDPKSEYAAVIPRFASACARGERPRVFGDGEQTRDFVYVADAVRANLLAADAAGASGEVVNVGSGRPTSLNELLGLLGEVTGRPVAATYAPARPGDVRHSLADVERAGKLLGYAPRTPLREGLRITAESFARDGR